MEAEDEIEAISLLSDPLSFNDKNHELFFTSLKRAWKLSEFTSDIEDDIKGKVIHARERLDKLARRDPSTQFTDIVITHHGTDVLTRLVLAKRDLKTLLMNIFRKTRWNNSVTRLEQIPTGIRSALHKKKIAIKRIFPQIRSTDDDGPYSAVCAPRFLYFVNGNGSCSLEDDDFDYASSSSLSESDEETIEDRSKFPDCEITYVEVKSEVEVFLHESEQVTVSQMHSGSANLCAETILKGIHPYQFSCAVFTLCQRLESKDWPARRIYCYVRDFLADQVRLDGVNDEKIYGLASEILHHASGLKESQEFQNMLDAFEGAANLVAKHQRKFKDDRVMMRRGRLEPFERITMRQLSDIAQANYYPFLSPSRGHKIPSVFHCPCDNPGCIPDLLQFERSRVSPLQIHSSLSICETKFRGTGKRPWSILFTRDKVVLIIDPLFLKEVLSDYVPYLINREKVIERTIPVPTYYIHIHNYFFGSRMGLCSSMEFLLKSFSWMRYSKSAYMPKSLDDPTIDSYKLLHLIIDKFETTSIIDQYLTNPMDQNVEIFQKKRKLAALGEDIPTLYASLRAFVLIYAPHTITKFALTTLYERFQDSILLTNKYPLIWRLIRKLLKRMPIDTTELVIPEKLFQYKDLDFEQRAEHVFDYPVHLLFYYLCASGDLSPEDSRLLFLSIGTCVRISGQMTLAKFCTSISLKKPLKKAPIAREAASHMAYTLLKIKEESIKPSALPIPTFAHGITHLFRSLEDLQYQLPGKLEETLLPLSSEQILANPANPPPIPVDFRHNYCTPRAGLCIPLWRSLVYDSSYRTNDVLSSYENIGRAMVYTGDTEMRPFWGCHEDMLECIVIHPIKNIQGLPLEDNSMMIIDPLRSSTLPLDLREITSSPSPLTPGGSPVTQRIEKLAQKFYDVYYDRNGWGSRPALSHVMFQTLHSQ